MGKGDGKETDDDGKGKGNVEILSKRYNSDDTDVRLVSSDGITFNVHSYRLRCFSSVLGSMFSLAQSDAQRDPIILTDPIIEHSAVIRYLLDIIHDLEVKSFADDDTCRHAIDLADKWDVPDVRRIVRQTLQGILYECSKYQGSSFALFVIAIKLQDYKLASGLIRQLKVYWSGTFRDHITSEKSPERTQPPMCRSPEGASKRLYYPGIAGKDIFDIQHCSYIDALKLPPTVLWVLLRAATECRERHDRFDRDIVAETFYRLMMEAYPESADKQVKEA